MIFRCDSKIKKNMLFTDKCRQQFSMSHGFCLRVFISVCSNSVLGVRVCRYRWNRRTNSLVYYFNYRSVRPITIMQLSYKCLGIRYSFFIAFFVNILKWERDDTFLSSGCCSPSMLSLCAKGANEFLNIVYVFQVHGVDETENKRHKHTYTHGKKVNKCSIKSVDRLRFFIRSRCVCALHMAPPHDGTMMGETEMNAHLMKLLAKECNWHGLSPSVLI